MPTADSELELLRRRLLLTIEFFERHAEFSLGAQFRDLVEHAKTQGSLRNMKLLAREVDQMAVALSPDQQDGLSAVLGTKLGVDRDAEAKAANSRLRELVRVGHVRSEKERQFVEAQLDRLVSTQGDADLISALKGLLSAN
jgi:hypothetical protein